MLWTKDGEKTSNFYLSGSIPDQSTIMKTKYCLLSSCNKQIFKYENVYCNSSCSAKKHNKGRILTAESKSKISASLKEYYKKAGPMPSRNPAGNQRWSVLLKFVQYFDSLF